MRRVFPLLLLAAACTKERAPAWPEVGATVPALEGVSYQPGRATLLFFGYTFCPDVCPLTLLTVKRATSGLSEAERSRVDVVFVTVDPKRDTTERLETYLGAFGTNIDGVVPKDLHDLIERFGLTVEYEKVETSTDADLYTVNHTSVVFLVDGAGRLAARIPHGAPPEQMRRQLHDLLETPR